MASFPFTITSNPLHSRFSNLSQNADSNTLLLHTSDYFPQISSLSKQGKLRQAVGLFTHMEFRGTRTRPDVYGELLQGCVYERDLFLGRQFHARIVKNGDSFSGNDFLETKLVILYAKCHARFAAARMFRSVSSQNLFSWAAIIGLNCRMGFCEEALSGFRDMLESGFSPDNFVVPNALKACGALRCAGTGKLVHGYAVKMGFSECVFVTSSLVDMYGKCGCLGDARKVFDKKSDRNVVTWNSLIVGNVQNGMSEEALKAFHDMRIDGVEPTQVTISSFLSASANLGAVGEGKQGHALAILQGLHLNTILGSSIVNFYSKVGLLDEAESVFARTVKRDTVTWNMIISGYVQTGNIEKALAMCRRMRSENLRFDAVTLTSLITASAKTANLNLGTVGHCYCIRNNFDSDVIAASTVVNMYAKCKRLDRARRVFDSVKRGDLVLWNTMLAAYAESGLSGEALKLFYRMDLENVPPNVVSYNSLISGLLKNGQVSEANEMFVQMESLSIIPNVVTWTTLVSGLAENGFVREAIEKFVQMQEHRIRPNVVSVVSVLTACIDMALLNYGKAIHGYTVRNLRSSSSTPLKTSLIDMYAKCGNSDKSKKIFDSIKDKETSIYNTMIACYALHGQATEALELYKHLKEEGKKPDSITLTNALNACSHSGLVDEALGLFSEMVSKHNLQPTMVHYGCVVRLLSKYGLLDEAFGILGSMAFEPDGHILGSMLDACGASNEVELAEYLSEKLMELDPDNSGNYVALSNAYAAAGKWDRVERVRRSMKDKGLVKIPGCSWIQIGDDFRVFVAGDKSHPETHDIYSTLSLLGF